MSSLATYLNFTYKRGNDFKACQKYLLWRLSRSGFSWTSVRRAGRFNWTWTGRWYRQLESYSIYLPNRSRLSNSFRAVTARRPRLAPLPSSNLRCNKTAEVPRLVCCHLCVFLKWKNYWRTTNEGTVKKCTSLICLPQNSSRHFFNCSTERGVL